MAKVLDTFDTEKARTRDSKFDEWLDGRFHMLEAGTDFDDKHKARRAIHGRAGKLGKRAKFYGADKDGNPDSEGPNLVVIAEPTPTQAARDQVDANQAAREEAAAKK